MAKTKTTKSAKMTREQQREVWDKISWEGGFEYFINGSSFPEVKAQDFRDAHKALVKAWRGMEKVLGPQPDETEEDLDSETESGWPEQADN